MLPARTDRHAPKTLVAASRRATGSGSRSRPDLPVRSSPILGVMPEGWSLMGRPSKYPAEFRVQAVEMVRVSGKPVAEITRDLQAEIAAALHGLGHGSLEPPAGVPQPPESAAACSPTAEIDALSGARRGCADDDGGAGGTGGVSGVASLRPVGRFTGRGGRVVGSHDGLDQPAGAVGWDALAGRAAWADDE